MKRALVAVFCLAFLLFAIMTFPSLRQVLGIAQPDRAEFDRARALFLAALAGERSDRELWRAIGLVAGDEGPAGAGVRIAEPEGACFGRGLYRLRPQPASPVAIMAPHRGSDRHTGEIARMIYEESRIAAGAWNSAPRRPLADCPHAIDLAKADLHPFTAFSLAFADHFAAGRIVQLHGFERTKRGDSTGQQAGMILSNGTREPNRALFDLADCLSIAFDPEPVAVFPTETGELGALTNAQGVALRDAGFDGFVHLEVSAELRAWLLRDKAARERLALCLTGGLE